MNTSVYDLLQKEPPFRVVAKTDLPAIEMKETRQCFTDPRYTRRDVLLNRFPVKQPGTDACTIWTIALARNSTHVQLAARILGVPEGTSRRILARLLVSRGHVMTLTQAEVIRASLRKRDRVSCFAMNVDGELSLHMLIPVVPKDVLYADANRLPQVVDRILVRNLNASWPWV